MRGSLHLQLGARVLPGETAPGPAALSRARQGSRNRQKARRRVAQIQERTANLRQEFLHQLSYLIVITWSVICFEDLSIKALARTKPREIMAREIMAGRRIRRTAAPARV